MSQKLLTPFRLGPFELKNRVVMAPLTRSRSPGGTPGELVARYYSQRTEAGLIITEGTSPSPNGLGYARIPGLYGDDQVRGWKRVTDAVHAGGSRMFVQLMHTGRVSHPANLPAGARVLAPSALAAPGKMWTDAQGEQPYPVPEAMTEAQIEQAIGEYVHSAELAMRAGFDGVELHGANGYLIEQFLNAKSNLRTDRWGGSPENRVRFALEVANRVAAKIGAERLGMRVSPYGAANGLGPDPQTDEVYRLLARGLSELGLVYMHVVDHSALGAPPVPAAVKELIRKNFRGACILCGGYDQAKAEADLQAGKGDLVAFGRWFIANPKLVSAFREGRALRSPDPSTFYSPGEKGYTDYV